MVARTLASDQTCPVKFSGDPRVAVWQREHQRIAEGLPPPNTDDRPRRHHYVPEVYLQRFSKRASRGAAQVRRIEARSGPTSAKTIGVRDAAVETDFYTIETDNPQHAHEAEHVIGVYEKAVGYAFQNLDKHGRAHFPDDIDRENLSHFMALQFVRGHDTGDFLEHLLTETSRLVLSTAAEHPPIIRRHLGESGLDTSDEAVADEADLMREAAGTVHATPHRNQTVAMVLDTAVELMPYFYARRWVIGCSATPLVTSDRPVLLLSDELDREEWRGLGVGTADSIVFVLDRHRLLLMRHPDEQNVDAVIDVSPRLASFVNIRLANGARRWVFHQPDDEPLGGVPFDPQPPATSGRSPWRSLPHEE